MPTDNPPEHIDIVVGLDEATERSPDVAAAKRQFAKSLRAVQKAWRLRRASHSRHSTDAPVGAVRPVRSLRRIDG